MCAYNEIQWNSFMKWSLANLRLRELLWDALDLSILEHNSQLGTWIQVLFSRRKMKKFTERTASICQSAFYPKMHSQGLGVLLYFWGFCLFVVLGEMLFLLSLVLFVCFVLGTCSLLGCLCLVGFYFGFIFCGFFFVIGVIIFPTKSDG